MDERTLEGKTGNLETFRGIFGNTKCWKGFSIKR
jgi:hypothetical protein